MRTHADDIPPFVTGWPLAAASAIVLDWSLRLLLDPVLAPQVALIAVLVAGLPTRLPLSA